MAFTVFVTAPKLAAAGMRRLDASGARVLFLTGTQDGAEVERIMAAEPVDAVISRTVDLSARAIDSCPSLKVVSKHGVGVSNIDVGACTRRGIPVYVTPGANAQSVAELAVGLLLAAARKVTWMDSELRQGRWSRAQDGLEMHGRTIGLIGFGQIGRKVATVCRAMGMKAVAFDPGIQGPGPVDGVPLVGTLEDLLKASDVISLHVPLTPKTRAMIGAAQLAMLPKNAIVINTARGEVIDEPALVDALRSGHLYAAGLDTPTVEPLPADSPLLSVSNIVITPHVGGSTPAALAEMARGAAANVLGFLEGQPADKSACVNPQVLS